MGYIKEPKGVNFVVNAAPLTEKDRKMISEAISYYKTTGRKKRIVTKKADSEHPLKRKTK